MGTFHNAGKETIRFTIDRDLFEVPPGASVMIPRAFEYVVGARGLLLQPGAHPAQSAPLVESVEAPRPAPIKMPPGVAAGGAIAADGLNDDDAAQADASAGSSDVDAQLDAQGAVVPKRRRR